MLKTLFGFLKRLKNSPSRYFMMMMMMMNIVDVYIYEVVGRYSLGIGKY